MGLLDDHEPNATPKLSLSKLPNKHMMRGKPLLMPTPPCKLLASVPFQWEEAPGKPRSSSIPSTKNNNSRNSTFTTAARRLDLPPRLVLINHSNSVDSSSSSSSSSSASSKFGSANFYSPTAVLDGPDDHECRAFSVLQKEYSVRSLEEEIIRDGKMKEHDWPALSESFGLSSSARRSSSSKLHRFKRRSSFASLSHASSNFLSK